MPRLSICSRPGVLGPGGAQEHGRVELRPPVHQDEHPQAEQNGETAAVHRPGHGGLAGRGAQQGAYRTFCFLLRKKRLCFLCFLVVTHPKRSFTVMSTRLGGFLWGCENLLKFRSKGADGPRRCASSVARTQPPCGIVRCCLCCRTSNLCFCRLSVLLRHCGVFPYLRCRIAWLCSTLSLSVSCAAVRALCVLYCDSPLFFATLSLSLYFYPLRLSLNFPLGLQYCFFQSAFAAILLDPPGADFGWPALLPVGRPACLLTFACLP